MGAFSGISAMLVDASVIYTSSYVGSLMLV